ncbi:MAG: ribonuclease E, partial [Colwellia sp.]|nr:ribonuclease E [Colwellia sp.]
EMSRQRLRPSIGETSQGVCPRCSGTGQVRGVESLALSVLRLMEEEAIKENTQHVQAQVPVPVATYLLNEKRRSVMHIEKHHGVRVLIIPNPHMDTPQYEVLRVKKDETVAEASYDISIKEAELEEAKMPKFDKEAAKRDEPIIQAMGQGMSAPKVDAAKAATTSAPAKAQHTESKPKGFFAWLKGLFTAEEVVEEKAPESKPKRKDNRGQQRGRQGQRRGNSRNNSGNRNDERNAEHGSKSNVKPGDKNRNTRNDRDDSNKQNSKAKKQTRKPEHDKKQVKEEVVAERRQRRTNRKKVRVNKAKDPAQTNIEQNNNADIAAVAEKDSTEQVNIDNVATQNATQEPVSTTESEKREGRPRNRRSPRHLRSNGQRKRREKPVEEAKEQVVEVADEAIEARYPEAEIQDKASTAQVADKTEIKEEQQQDLPFVNVEPEVDSKPVTKVEVNAEPETETKVEVEVNADTKTEVEAKAEISSTIQQESAPVEDTPVVEEPAEVEDVAMVETKDTVDTEADLTVAEANAETKTENASAIEESEKDSSIAEPTVEEKLDSSTTSADEAIVTSEPEVAKAVEAEANEDETPAVKKETVKKAKATPAAKPARKSAPKDKKLARQVKKANRLSGRATSPMTKTETITTINEIPTSFMLSEDRVVHQVSGRTAITADVASRSSAKATKPA